MTKRRVDAEGLARSFLVLSFGAADLRSGSCVRPEKLTVAQPVTTANCSSGNAIDSCSIFIQFSSVATLKCPDSEFKKLRLHPS
jgi:hypothetical protein